MLSRLKNASSSSEGMGVGKACFTNSPGWSHTENAVYRCSISQKSSAQNECVRKMYQDGLKSNFLGVCREKQYRVETLSLKPPFYSGKMKPVCKEKLLEFSHVYTEETVCEVGMRERECVCCEPECWRY